MLESYPASFALYQLAEWDENTGLFKTLTDGPKIVAPITQLLEIKNQQKISKSLRGNIEDGKDSNFCLHFAKVNTCEVSKLWGPGSVSVP